MQYSEKVVDLFTNPRHVGTMDEDDPNVGTGVVGSPACGDVMKLQLRIEDGRIADAKFKTFGCGAAIASASYITELVIGKSIEQAEAISNREVAADLQLPPVKVHCSVLAEDGIRGALEDWRKKQAAASASA